MRDQRRARSQRIAALGVLALGPLALVALIIGSGENIDGASGALTEPLYTRPDDVPPVDLQLATETWGLDEISLNGADPMSGGATLADLDGDQDLDLIAANGRVVVLLWAGDSFAAPIDLGIGDAVSVAVADIDADGWPDIAIARTGEQDRIVWGGPWVTDSNQSMTSSDLAGGHPSAMLLPVDLTGDASPELVRLGRGEDSGSDDVIWSRDGVERSFSSITLPRSDRLSLAGTASDVDRDGLLDLWITRDIGWETGGDSVYSRRGDPNGPWFDIADELGAALEIDGMGITLADLDGDTDLDAYVSDIGENDVLARSPSGFSPLSDTGAGRIRPPSQPNDIVSSSWASGAADLNLDGRLDLIVVGGGFPETTIRNKVPETSVVDAEPPAVFLGIGNGQFVDAWPETGLDLNVVGRSLTLGDVDGDGDTDAIIVTYDGRLAGLRNDTDRASLTVILDDRCGEGVELTLTAPQRSFSVLVPQFTYGGVHARQVIIGSNQETVVVSATFGTDSLFRGEFEATTHRRTVAVECGAKE